jgi:hypothetical protein
MLTFDDMRMAVMATGCILQSEHLAEDFMMVL